MPFLLFCRRLLHHETDFFERGRAHHRKRLARHPAPPVGEPWRKFVRRIGIALRTQSLAEPAQKRQHQQRAEYWRIMSKGVDLNVPRSEEHTSELQSLMRISYAVFCLKK